MFLDATAARAACRRPRRPRPTAASALGERLGRGQPLCASKRRRSRRSSGRPCGRGGALARSADDAGARPGPLRGTVTLADLARRFREGRARALRGPHAARRAGSARADGGFVHRLKRAARARGARRGRRRPRPRHGGCSSRARASRRPAAPSRRRRRSAVKRRGRRERPAALPASGSWPAPTARRVRGGAPGGRRPLLDPGLELCATTG